MFINSYPNNLKRIHAFGISTNRDSSADDLATCQMSSSDDLFLGDSKTEKNGK